MERHFIQRRGGDLLSLLTLAVCSFLYLKGYAQAIDLDPWDEAYYIAASHSAEAAWRGPGWSQGYILFYRMLRLFWPSSIEVYYASALLQTAGLSFVIYLVARRMRVSAIWSLVAAFFTLIATVQLEYTNKVNHFNAIVYGLLFLGATYLRHELARAALIAFASLVLVYLRQENLLYGIGFLAYAVWLALKSSPDRRRGIVRAMALGLAFAAGYTVTQNVNSPFEPERTWSTFADHYCWRRYDRGVPGCFRNNNETEAQKIFGGSRSVVQATVGNPREMSAHLLANVRDLPGSFFGAFTQHYPLIPDAGKNAWKSSPLEVALIALLFAGLLLGAWLTEPVPMDRGRRPSLGDRFAGVTGFERLALVLGIGFIVKSVLLTTMLSPWTRYHLEPVLFAYVWLAWAMDRFAFHLSASRWATGLVALLLLAMCPSVRTGGSAQPVKLVAEAVNGLPGLKNVFADFPPVLYGKGDHRRWSPLHYDRELRQGHVTSFGDFLERHSVDAVLLNQAASASIAGVDERLFVKDRRPLLVQAREMGYLPQLGLPDGTVLLVRPRSIASTR